MNSKYAIKTENLAKRYPIIQNRRSFSLRDTLSHHLMQAYIKIKDLCSGFTCDSCNEDSFWAVDHVNIEIKHGEIIGIIGNNGSGKSTLLKLFSRITEPTEGIACLSGRVASLLEVGTGFHPELTGRENVFLNGSILGMSHQEIKKKFDEIVAFSGVEKFLDTPVKHYSSGMYVRLAFSVAAHLEPDILIIDEVLAVGDLNFQKKCLKKMDDVSNSGKTVLFVSHNLTAVQALCPRAIHIEQGKVVADGNSKAVIAGYLQRYSQSQTSIRWNQEESPGNAFFRIQSVTVLDEVGESRDSFPLSIGIRVRIAYTLLSSTEVVRFCLTVDSEQGICVFSTVNALEKIANDQPGCYEVDCSIPPDIFNNGLYYVSIRCFGSVIKDSIDLERIVSFEMYDNGDHSEGYFGEYRGLLRPKLQWSYKNVNVES